MGNKWIREIHFGQSGVPCGIPSHRIGPIISHVANHRESSLFLSPFSKNSTSLSLFFFFPQAPTAISPSLPHRSTTCTSHCRIPVIDEQLLGVLTNSNKQCSPRTPPKLTPLATLCLTILAPFNHHFRRNLVSFEPAFNDLQN